MNYLKLAVLWQGYLETFLVSGQTWENFLYGQLFISMKVVVMRFELKFQLFHANAFIKKLKSVHIIMSSTLTILAMFFFFCCFSLIHILEFNI